MLHKFWIALLIAGLLWLPAPGQAAKDYLAKSYDVKIDIQPGGDLLVTETVVFRFIGGPFTYVYREIPIDGMDGVDDVTASMDGQFLSVGVLEGQVEIKQGNPLVVTWHFAPLISSSHTYTLAYRVRGGIRKQGGQDVLNWDALPNRHAYPIQSSTVRVIYPASTAQAGEPSVLRGQAQIESSLQQVIFTAVNLSANAPLQVEVYFEGGSLIQSMPAWQQAEQSRQQALALAFILGVIAFLAVLGISAAGIILYTRRAADIDRETGPAPVIQARPATPPSNLPPALAGALISYQARPAWSNGLATLLDLAQRGAISIQELPKSGLFGQRDFVISPQERPAGLLPHEQALWDILFRDEAGPRQSLKVSELRAILPGAWPRFSDALEQELQAAGLVSGRRREDGKRLGIGGLLAFLLGLALGIGGFTAARSLSSTMPALVFFALMCGAGVALAVAGFAAMLAGVSHSPYTSRGQQQAQSWRGFSAYLRDAARGKETPPRTDSFEAYLPLAASFGLAVAWTRNYRRQSGAKLPVWFQALSSPQGGEGDMAAFVAMMDMTASSGDSSAGGGGDGGGGGGGSSGAG